MQRQKATISVLLAGILWGIISIFIKKLSAAGLTSLQISTVRMIVASITFLIVSLLWDPKKLKIRLKDLWMFIGSGIISVTLFNVFYFYTMIRSQASIAVVLLYTSPIFVMLFSAVLFQERITLQKIIALFMTFAGCVLTAGLLGGGTALKPLILLTGLSSGLFYALYTIFGRYALEKYDTITVTTYTFLFGLIGSLPISEIGTIATTVVAKPSLLWWCLGIGIFCTVLPYFLYTWGLQRMESGKAAILVAVEPLVGAVLGMTFFHESKSFPKIVGIILILGAILLLNWNLSNQKTD